MTRPCAVADIKLVVNIGGVWHDAQQVSCEYAMNQIPTCLVLLCPGLEMRTGTPSPAHYTMTLPLGAPLEIYVRYHTLYSSGPTLIPDGEYLLFRGWVSNRAYQRQYDKLAMAVSGIHWLGALDFASIYSAAINPGSSGELLAAASLIGPDGQWPSLYQQDMFCHCFEDPTIVLQDLWGNFFLPWFRYLANSRHLAMTGIGLEFGEIMDVDGKIQAALNTFQGGPLIVDDTETYSSALAISLLEQLAMLLAVPGLSGLAQEAQVTIWKKLVGHFGPSLFFSVIMGPHWAQVIPFMPGIRWCWEPHGPPTIRGEDILACQIAAPVTHFLRGVYMPLTASSLTGLIAQGDGGTLGGLGGGKFDTLRPGMILVEPCPSFLESLPGGTLVYNSLGTKDRRLVANVADHPQPSDSGQSSSVVTPAKYQMSNAHILHRFARARYVLEVLRERQVRITCPLRFDISPGSNVSFAVPDGPSMCGTVVKVSYNISCTSGETSCVTYDVHFVRTTMENMDPSYSLERHPLYMNFFVGRHFT